MTMTHISMTKTHKDANKVHIAFVVVFYLDVKILNPKLCIHLNFDLVKMVDKLLKLKVSINI